MIVSKLMIMIWIVKEKLCASNSDAVKRVFTLNVSNRNNVLCTVSNKAVNYEYSSFDCVSDSGCMRVY